jgi:hypothetical protein
MPACPYAVVRTRWHAGTIRRKGAVTAAFASFRHDGVLACRHDHMAADYVHIMTNPCMPGLIKVRWTLKDPQERARELSRATGVAAPFVVVWFCEVDDPKIERLAHAKVG